MGKLKCLDCGHRWEEETSFLSVFQVAFIPCLKCKSSKTDWGDEAPVMYVVKGGHKQ